jgi:hypothetical protein
LSSGSVADFLGALEVNIPWKQLVYAIDRVIGDAREHVTQISLRIDSNEFATSYRVPNYAEPLRL